MTGVLLCGNEAAINLVKLKKYGVSINISSITYHGNYGQSNYFVAKTGVDSMIAFWIKELVKYQIRVRATVPDFTRTEMLMSLCEDVKKKNYFACSTPMFCRTFRGLIKYTLYLNK